MDIQAQKVAGKYAKAFLNYIGDVLQPSHCETLQKAATAFKQHSDDITLLKIPNISANVKKEGLLAWFKALEIPVDITKLLDILAGHQRLFLFPTILQELCEEYYKRNNIVEFCIKATLPLNKEQIDSVHAFLEHKSGKRIRSTFMLEKNLIAGIRLQSDTYLWEYSLRQRIRNIANIV